MDSGKDRSVCFENDVYLFVKYYIDNRFQWKTMKSIAIQSFDRSFFILCIM